MIKVYVKHHCSMHLVFGMFLKLENKSLTYLIFPLLELNLEVYQTVLCLRLTILQLLFLKLVILFL
jgi:hypothetical protein